jgi:cytidylate kinase
LKIALTGLAGVGKSDTVNALISMYGLVRRSSGDFFRQTARERGISLLQLEKLAETDKTIDFEVDRLMTEFGLENDNFIVDARLAGECVPRAVKILLVCDDEVRMMRVALRDGVSIDDARHETMTREKSIRQRFKRYYGIDRFDDPKKFDLVVDTTNMNPVAVVQKIVVYLEEKGHVPKTCAA